MIDQTYFEKHFEEQRALMPGSCTVRLHLNDGTVVELYRIEGKESGYLLVQAYPIDGSAPVSERREDRGLKNGPRLAIPYETILRVELTREVPKDSPGFQASAP